MIRELMKRDGEWQRDERERKIRESRYNKWYKKIKGKGIPRYLRKGWGESRWKRIARYRLRNEMREGRYWEEEEKRRCRLCGGEEKTWEHVWESCRKWKKGGRQTGGSEVGSERGRRGEEVDEIGRKGKTGEGEGRGR